MPFDTHRALINSTASDAPQREDFDPGHLEAVNELVSARLRCTQSSIESSLSELNSDLARLENALLSKRKMAWVRTGLV